MFNLKEAYKKAKQMGRSGSQLKINSIRVQAQKFVQNTMVTVVARVESNKVQIAWVAEPGKKKLQVKDTDKVIRVHPLQEPYDCYVQCECKDFLDTFYRFILKSDRYVRKIDLVKNQAVKLGMCQHLMAVVDQLKEEGWII